MSDYKINLDIFQQLGAKIIGDWETIRFSSICIDSKIVNKNSLFIGLQGSNIDGSNFALQAIANGASAVIVSKEIVIDVPQIVSENVMSLIYRYSLIARERYKGTLIAVCGSAGKTTAKNYIASLLPGNVLYTKRSFNLKVSICCTFLLLTNSVDYFVVECGHSVIGEMDDLGRMIKPDYTIYTTIGEEHIDNFKDLETIKREQSKILNYNKSSFVADQEFVEFVEKEGINVLGFYPKDVKISENYIEYKTKTYNIKPRTTSALKNTIAKVIALFDLLGIPINSEGFLAMNTVCMRGNVIRTPKGNIYDYGFNLNTTSLENTLEFIGMLCQDGSKVDFIYALMSEDDSRLYNKNALESLVKCSHIRRIYTVNIQYDHPKSKNLNPEEDFPHLLENVVIQGSKFNNLISITCQLINYRLGRPKSPQNFINL